MFEQITLMTEFLITCLTGIWTVATVHALMSDQMTLMAECLSTNITRKWTLATIYANLFVQHNLVKNKNNILTYLNTKKMSLKARYKRTSVKHKVLVHANKGIQAEQKHSFTYSYA
jgi:hypothetical protein